MKKAVRIIVSGGVVQGVEFSRNFHEDEIDVHVMDYDIYDSDESILMKDEDGDQYFIATYSPDEIRHTDYFPKDGKDLTKEEAIKHLKNGDAIVYEDYKPKKIGKCEQNHRNPDKIVMQEYNEGWWMVHNYGDEDPETYVEAHCYRGKCKLFIEGNEKVAPIFIIGVVK